MLPLIFLAVLLSACQQQESAENQLVKQDDLIRMSFSEQSGERRENFEQRETLRTLDEIFSSATEIKGFPMLSDPEYYVDAVYQNTEQTRYHLWIGDKGQESTIRNEGENDTLYRISPKGTDRLIHLVEKIFRENNGNKERK